VNEVLEAIGKRYSARAYKDAPLTEAQREALINAALAAPSAWNKQPYQVIGVGDRELLRQIDADVLEALAAAEPAAAERVAGRGGKVMYDAPFVIFVPVADASHTSLVDVGIAAQNICLAAHSLGLGSVIMAMPLALFSGEKGAYWRERLGFYEGYGFGIAVAAGVSDAENAPHPLKTDRVSIIG
jgi:nitroreductase